METKRNNVFVSYSHKDGKWLERLKTHLQPLIRDGKLNLWDDTRIKPGSNWRDEIEMAINNASVAILLVSADFLASNFISENELPPLLKKAETEGAIIVSVIVSSCRFVETQNISQFQAVNDPSKPLSSQSRSKQEKVFFDLSKHIEQSLSERIFDELDQKTAEKPEENIISPENSNSEVDNSSSGFTHLSLVSRSVVNATMEAAKGATLSTGVPTGIRELDHFNLLNPSELILVAGRPFMGLSAFAQTIALNAANLENRVTAYFSMSTAQDKFVSEMICGEARVDVNRFPTGYLTRYEWGRIGDAVKTLEESTIFLEDKYDISVDEIQTKLKTLLVQQGKLDLVIVDNLQYLSASQKTRAKNYEPSQILYELKGIAKELNIPIIVICQLPASEGNYLGYPNHIDLNKAGIFEQFADISIMIHREEVYKPTIENQGIAKITVSNLHNGLTRTFDLVFLKEFNRFENYVSNYEEVKNDD